MSLIHHAVCQQTCTESILNLFNEKQLSSKLEARKCLKIIWSDFGLWNKFWLSVWREDFFFWHKTKMTNFPCRSRKKISSVCAHTWLKHTWHFSCDWQEYIAFLGFYSMKNHAWLCFNLASNRSQVDHQQLSRQPLESVINTLCISIKRGMCETTTDLISGLYAEK